LTNGCPLCHIASDRLFLLTADVIGVWDAFPVSPGHALLVTKRHVATWYEATREERAALAEATESARQEIVKRYKPQGFNIGINAGEAAGQTVFHLHVHVIPRYSGDVPNPRGGVRGVVPSRRDYSLASTPTALPPSDESCPKLIQGGADEPFLPHLERHLAEAQAVDIAVAFTLGRGVELLFPHLEDFLARGGTLRFLTGDYRDCTEPAALLRLLDLQGDAELRVFVASKAPVELSFELHRAFHPKSYILCRADGSGVAFVGSSNVSESALRHGVEWNYGVSSDSDAQGFAEIRDKFEELFHSSATEALTIDWIEEYSKRHVALGRLNPVMPVENEAEPLEVRSPHEIQEEALAALEVTRAEGNRAGLVVLATGLGKTWLSAFDTMRPEFRRVLFVAHREEILGQAKNTFRQIRPDARLGLYMGSTRDEYAEILFASIQTLGRREHLNRFARDAFDYIVIDEFHHAAAASYRGLIEHFEPQFLLGLTATPERTDGGNLLALCQENLVYRADLREGINRGLLAPFHYFGVPDDVDYNNIPWRSNRFDEEALTNAVATQRRAQNALDQLRKRGGKRTLAFCVSTRHADFMAEFFQQSGLRAVAVHSGSSSAPRALSLEHLASSEIDIVCAVDMFNEGVDVPELDTVLMLRPTGSRLLWLQQLGRGLRKAAGKTHLNVIDYIGNHRTFLIKPQTLFDLPSGRQEMLAFLDQYRAQTLELPAGCEVTYDLEAVEILSKLVQLQPGRGDVLRRYYEDFREVNGVRPMAAEVFHDGYNPHRVRAEHKSWLGFVRSMGDLSAEGRAVLDAHDRFFSSLDSTDMVKSYKMVVLLAMLNADSIPGEIGIDHLVEKVSQVASRTAALRADFGGAIDDPRLMKELLETNPINAWVGGRGTGGVSYFRYSAGVFSCAVIPKNMLRPAFQEMVRELVEWRLAEYLSRVQRAETDDITCKVSHSNGRPILFLPDRARHPGLPSGEAVIVIDGEPYLLDFVKIAVNMARKTRDGSNELPRILRGWFGADAGLPGTRNAVVLRKHEGDWLLAPEGRQQSALQLWRAYSREQIPPFFGMQFSTAIWNVGYVRRSGHIFLLVTLDKSGHGSEFQYEDRFLDAVKFEWKSQNRTSQSGVDGKAISNHEAAGTDVHLFIRPSKKTGNRSAAFIYCGDVKFVEWGGNNPVTVRWKLSEPVPERLCESLKVPKPL
jgi:superfamily II DNA or RNA helicase/HKD family nuclease